MIMSFSLHLCIFNGVGVFVLCLQLLKLQWVVCLFCQLEGSSQVCMCVCVWGGGGVYCYYVLYFTPLSLTDDFGAFTGASQPPTPVVSTSLAAPTPSTALSAGDKYAALASLDNTFRDLKVPSQQPSPIPVPKNQSQPFGSTSAANPFGTPSGPVQSNPFTGQQQQSTTGGQQQQPFGGSQPQQQGQAFGQPQAFGNQQAVFQGGQGFAGQPQQFGAFGQQQMPPGKFY